MQGTTKIMHSFLSAIAIRTIDRFAHPTGRGGTKPGLTLFDFASMNGHLNIGMPRGAKGSNASDFQSIFISEVLSEQ